MQSFYGQGMHCPILLLHVEVLASARILKENDLDRHMLRSFVHVGLDSALVQSSLIVLLRVGVPYSRPWPFRSDRSTSPLRTAPANWQMTSSTSGILNPLAIPSERSLLV